MKRVVGELRNVLYIIIRMKGENIASIYLTSSLCVQRSHFNLRSKQIEVSI